MKKNNNDKKRGRFFLSFFSSPLKPRLVKCTHLVFKRLKRNSFNEHISTSKSDRDKVKEYEEEVYILNRDREWKSSTEWFGIKSKRRIFLRLFNFSSKSGIRKKNLTLN